MANMYGVKLNQIIPSGGDVDNDFIFSIIQHESQFDVH
jgi:hypothetical protein